MYLNWADLIKTILGILFSIVTIAFIVYWLPNIFIVLVIIVVIVIAWSN